MGLDFTKIRDEPGSAIFFIHDGTEQVQKEFRQLQEEVSRRTKKQIITLSSKDGDGYQVVKFYNLRGSKFVIIVRDDDQLHVENVIGKLQQECLDEDRSHKTLEERAKQITLWLNDYHFYRPHQALNYLTPAEYCATLNLTILRQKVSTM